MHDVAKLQLPGWLKWLEISWVCGYDYDGMRLFSVFRKKTLCIDTFSKRKMYWGQQIQMPLNGQWLKVEGWEVTTKWVDTMLKGQLLQVCCAGMATDLDGFQR